MNKIDLFKIRKVGGAVEPGAKQFSTYISGKEAVIELIKQKCNIFLGELWWDQTYGLNFQNLNELSVSFWLREVIASVEYVKEIKSIEINRLGNKFNIDLSIELINNEIENSKFNI